jgi:hypothetical protein
VVWKNLHSEDALAHWGLLRHGNKFNINTSWPIRPAIYEFLTKIVIDVPQNDSTYENFSRV